MATIVNNIRWATNSAELAANLKQGLNQIEATRASAEKLVQSLSGDKLIAAAHKWAAAIAEVGGADKLISSERERANAILEKAIQKYEALGTTAPLALRKLADATKDWSLKNDDAGASHGKLSEAIRLNIPLVQGLTARFNENVAALGTWGLAIGGIAVAFMAAKKAMDVVDNLARDASALKNLATETGIGVEELQAISLATKDFGVDAGELARGVFDLSRRVAGDDTSAAAAFAVMGLSIQELKDLQPEQLFLTTMRAINQIPDAATKAAVAGQLFGAKFAQGLLAIGPGLDDLVEKARHSNEIIGKDGIEALDRYANAMDHLDARWKAAKAEGLLPLMEGINQFIELLRSGTVEQELAKAFSPKDWWKAFFGTAPGSVSMQPPPGLNLGNPFVTGAFTAFGGGSIVDTRQSSGPAAISAAAGGSQPAPGAFMGPISQAQTAATAMANTLAVLRKQIVPLTAEQDAWLRSLAAIGPQFLTTANLLGTGITPQQLELWKTSLGLQQELVKARASAARDNASADAAETEGLQNAISTRIAALDAEHQATVKGIQLEIESSQKKNAQLLAEDITYQAKRRLLQAEGAAAVVEIERASAEEIARLQSSNKTKSLADQLVAIDEEVAAQQRAALQKIGYTDDEWKAEYAIYLAGEARKQNLIDVSNKKEVDAEAKLRAEIAGLDLEANTVGLARTLASINAKQALEVAALDQEVLSEEDHQKRLALIDEKYGKERGNAILANEREIGKELLQVRQQTEDAVIALTLTGMEAELAANDVKRRRRLDQLALEGKATADVIVAENQLFDVQATAIIAKWDPIHKAWLGLNTDMRQQWADTWTQALDGTGSFAAALLSPFKQIEQAWLRLLGAMLADWENRFLSKLTGLNFSTVSGGGGVSGGLTSLLGGAGTTAGMIDMMSATATKLAGLVPCSTSSWLP